LNQPSSIRKRRGGTPGFWALMAVGAIIVIVVLAILVDSAVYYNKVHSGVSVVGIELGGQTRAEATATLQGVVDQAQNSPLTLTYGGKSWTLMPSEVGAKMDVEAAVKAAMGVSRDGNIFSDIGTRWKLFFSKRDLSLTGSVDDTKMQAFVAGVAKDIDVTPVNAALSIENGQIKVVDSVQGKAVEQTALADTLKSLLVTLHSTTVEIPVVVTEPKVKAEDNAEAQKQAETMISGPVTLTHGTSQWAITAQEIASYMGFTSKDVNGVSTLVPVMDATKLQPLLALVEPAVASEPVNATFESDGAKAWVVDGKDGEQLDSEATAQAITAATLKIGDRTVEAITKKKEPELTTQEAKDMGISDLLSSYTTKYTGSGNRQVNVKITTQYATGVMLAPGQEYNFDKQIGPRTPARGFRKAPGIVGPNTLEDVLGGGICQVSTTMFNAAIEAGLKITERHNHSIYIDHYPKGRDATVTDGGKNLRFKNDTDHYIWIRGVSTGTVTTISMYGTKDGRTVAINVGNFYGVSGKSTVTVKDSTLKSGKSEVLDKGQTGKSLRTTYVVTRDGQVINSQVFISTWPMYPMQIRVGTATTSSTAPPPTDTTPPTVAP
jgi:vancomycin resistance protein YoaR